MTSIWVIKRSLGRTWPVLVFGKVNTNPLSQKSPSQLSDISHHQSPRSQPLKGLNLYKYHHGVIRFFGFFRWAPGSKPVISRGSRNNSIYRGMKLNNYPNYPIHIIIFFLPFIGGFTELHSRSDQLFFKDVLNLISFKRRNAPITSYLPTCIYK